jgi:hypothetical protein
MGKSLLEHEYIFADIFTDFVIGGVNDKDDHKKFLDNPYF